MGLYEFYTIRMPPDVPARSKEDVLEIAKRWDDFHNLPNDEIDFDQLEEDLHALVAIAMEALPD